MREMKDSGFNYLGEIPASWPTCRLKSCFRVSRITGRMDATVLSLYRDYGIVPKDSRADNHNVTSFDTSKYKFVEVGDFVINKMKGWQGSMALSAYEGIVSPAYHVFKFINSGLVPEYAHYLLRCRSYADEWHRLSTGLRIGQWDLHVEDFLNTRISLPPLSEQRRIADYLDEKCAEIDRAVSAAEQSVQECVVYKKSLITETVQRVGGKRLRLRHLCSRVFDGPFGSHLKSADYIDEGIRVVRLENLRYMSFDDSKRSFVSQEKYETIARHTVIPTDLIMATFVAKEVQVASLPEGVQFAVNKADCVGLRLKSEMCVNRYVQYALSSNVVFDYLRSNLHGTTRDRVNTSQIKEIPLLIPCLDEQRRIADYLDDRCTQVDSAIAAKQAIIFDLKAYKQSLIYEVVTGKREV